VAPELLVWLGAGAAAWKELKAAKSAQSSSIAHSNYYSYSFLFTCPFLFFLLF
jgi:hypothetical protein